MDNPNRHEDDYRWNPESAYGKSGSRRLIAFILAVIVLGAAAFWFFQTQQSVSGDVALKASMRFDEADRNMQKAGFVPLFKTEKHGNLTARYYEGRNILGLLPSFTVLQYLDDGTESEYRIGHAFEDESSSSWENPGEVFLYLEKKLSEKYGAPEIRNDSSVSYYAWTRKNHSLVFLGYPDRGMAVLFFVYTR